MAVTAKEIAKKLNISAAAVSMALNGRQGVSSATRKKVFEEAKKMGYDFSKLTASSEPKIEQGTITFVMYKKHGAVVESSTFFTRLLEGIEMGCQKKNFVLNISYIYEDDNIKEKIAALPYSNGIILLGTEMKPEDFRAFEGLKIPLVVLDVYYESLNFDCVLINNLNGAYTAANYIIKKCKKQPGYLHSSYSIGNFYEREDGFYKAVRENGFSASKSQVLKLSPSLDGAYNDMLELLKSGEEVSRCYFADNDLIAAGAIKALREFGLNVPKDVSVIGFDNIELSMIVEPPLTTINVPKQYMGQMAVWRIAEIIASKDNHPIKIEINTQLIERKST